MGIGGRAYVWDETNAVVPQNFLRERMVTEFVPPALGSQLVEKRTKEIYAKTAAWKVLIKVVHLWVLLGWPRRSA